MHIAVLSDWETSGGANIAAVRLTEGFAAAGHRITRIYQKANTDDPRWQTRLIPSFLATHELALPGKIAWRMVPDSVRLARHQRKSERSLAEVLDEVRPDVINLHNLHIGNWSPQMIRVCAAQAPTVCTLHDTWTLTGRCYNPGPCRQYLAGCTHECPTATEYPALKPRQIAPAWNLRREILGECTNLAAVAPSKWLAGLAAAGIWKSRRVFHIPCGLDLGCYMPQERAAGRQRLGLRDDAPVLLCSAAELGTRKKGLHLVIEALAAGLGRRVQLLLLGSPMEVPPLPDVDIHALGYIESDRIKAEIYSSADIYVHPSLADNAPNTVSEALACGTPVVAFPVDGLPEMVIPGQTGWLASSTSATSLKAALKMAISDVEDGAEALRESCRRFAEQMYDMKAIVPAYQQVFDSMLAGKEDIPILKSGPLESSLTSIGS